MARLAMCGWESGKAEELGTELVVAGDGLQFTTNSCTGLISRSGTYSWRLRCEGNTGQTWRVVSLPTPRNEIWVRLGVGGCAGDGATSPGSIWHFLQCYDGSTLQIALGYSDATRTVRVYRGTTLIAEGGALPTSTTFVCVEARILIAAASGKVTVLVNGAQVLDYSGDTLESATEQITRVNVGMGLISSAGWHREVLILDDFAINDTTGTRNNGRIGQGGIIALWPNADTADKDWARSAGSDNYALVNSVPPDDDATYVTATSVGDRDLYEFGNLTNVNSIDAIAISGRLKTTFGAGAPVGFAMRSGATTGDVGSHQAAGAWTTFTDVVEADPNTAAAWTLAAVNSLQAGFTIL